MLSPPLGPSSSLLLLLLLLLLQIPDTHTNYHITHLL
jgi:hypothetical protein